MSFEQPIKVGNEAMSVAEMLALILPEQKEYAPPLEGNYYKTLLINIDNQMVIVKMLKPSGDLPKDEFVGEDRATTFQRHQDEYRKLQQFFEDSGIVLPTGFIADHDTGTYLTFQEFLPNPVFQYKLWELGMVNDLPDLGDTRSQVIDALELFASRLTDLFDQQHPYLVDVDFFITNQAPWIIVFDSSHFWPDKLGGKDRIRVEYRLRQFIKQLNGPSR